MAFVAGKNTLASGTGEWTLNIPADATIAIDDPGTHGVIMPGEPVPDADYSNFPSVKLVITLTADGTTTVHVVGDDSTHMPTPVDSIGYTANMEVVVVNETGHDLTGLTLDLSNRNPVSPNLGSSVVHYGEAVYDANYAYFTKVQPVKGETISLFDPNGNSTTSAGAAPSELVLTGDIPNGATVTSDSVVHNTELSIANNDFDLSVTDTVSSASGLSVRDMTSNGQLVPAIADSYSGPVSGLDDQYINITPDNLNITATTPNWFIHSGSGTDAIQVNSGTNVLDGGTGSNFLVGGSGTDTFYVDDRGPTADIWSTVAGFHKGDAATIWGVTPQDFTLSWANGQGASGFTGLTLHATAAGKPTASLTLSGYTTADLSNGRLGVVFGTVDGNTYMYIHGTG